MDYFLENSAPIWVAGALALTMAGIVYAMQRSRGSQLAIVVVVLLTVAALVVEHLWQTPREQVVSTLEALLAAVEADDVPGVLAILSPSATEMRNDAETLMPEFEIDKARTTGSVEVSLSPETEPTTATAEGRVFVAVRHRQSGMKGGNFARVTFGLERQGDAWLVRDYSVSEDWRRKAGQMRRGR